MKIFVTLFMIAFSSTAFALPVVEDVTQITKAYQACPTCMGQMITETTFTFSERWCRNPVAEDTYEIVVQSREQMMGIQENSVAVQLKHDGAMVDCFGPTHLRTFKLTTTELFEGERYILKNPTVL